ncbi:MAG: transporter substrate-binding domain-containing protein [Halopseudomonas sp.]|uniref:substrate-binding periplasmic protein n=1 Tax=Halopseudomonas sp. TaxID=2901191 RepID=UPI0030035276
MPLLLTISLYLWTLRGCAQVVTALWLLWLGAAPAQAALPVLVIATSELPPYVSATPQNSFLTDLLQEIGKEMDVRFEFRFMPWPRCELAVETHQAWATMPYVPTAERKQKFLFSQPLYAKRTMLFYYHSQAGKPDTRQLPTRFQQLSELSPYRLGGVRGYYYEKLFAEAGLSLELASSEELSFRKLHAGRVDLVPAVETVGWDIIRSNFAQEQSAFSVLDTPLDVGHNYLMTSRYYPNAEHLLEQFNQALQTLRRTGMYSQIAMRHGVPEND